MRLENCETLPLLKLTPLGNLLEVLTKRYETHHLGQKDKRQNKYETHHLRQKEKRQRKYETHPLGQPPRSVDAGAVAGQ